MRGAWAAIAALGLLGGCASPEPRGALRPSLSGSSRWMCFYGSSLPEELYYSLQLAILDADVFHAPARKRSRGQEPFRLAYVSVGQADSSRAYWPKAAGKSFLLHAHPDWKGVYYADIRAREWQDLLLDEVVPAVLAKDYDGVFLDALDAAQYLEELDRSRFSGSVQAMEGFVARLRRRFPRALIVTHNALSSLSSLGPHLDGAAADVYARYDFSAQRYEATAEAEDRSKEGLLKDFRKGREKPVFALLYASEEDRVSAARGIARAESLGFYPYAASITLDKPGTVAPQFSGERP